VHLAVARAQCGLAGGAVGVAASQALVQRIRQRGAVALVEQLHQVVDRAAGRLGGTPAGEALRRGVEKAHAAFPIGRDHAVADRRERHLQPLARLAGLLLGLRALALVVVDHVRHPEHQRAEGGDHHRGEQRHAHRLAEQPAALGEQARPAHGERHEESRRQQPARHHCAGAAPREHLEQPRRRPRRGKPDRGEHGGDRARRREAEQRRGNVEAQDPQAQAEQREECHRAGQRRGGAVQRNAEQARARRQRRDQREHQQRRAHHRGDVDLHRGVEKHFREREARDQRDRGARHGGGAPAAALGGEETGGEQDEGERRARRHRREVRADVAQPGHAGGPAPQRHRAERGDRAEGGVRDARQPQHDFRHRHEPNAPARC
jgi:hypothetical protein